MEGSLCRFCELVELNKKYKAYLYVDEGDSIGAIGDEGGCMANYWNIGSHDIDVHMGTFTKTLGAAGSYIAGKKVPILFSLSFP
jgi:serine palmitoyltransferase